MRNCLSNIWMRKRSDIELLAPVGSRESLVAAAQGGADAIYFGIAQLNMRSRSSANFSENDLSDIVTQARDSGLKTYLTVNTVVFNSELDQMKRIIDLASDHRVDAVIASDPSVLHYCRSRGVRVHLSTQLNISNAETLQFYAGFAEAAVLARELDLEQVGAISQCIKKNNIRGPSGDHVRIELFVHGALCMATSGKCYLSLHEHNHSANRGDCFQVCRRAYTVKDLDREVELDIENEYIMSPKDLKTIHFMDRILDAGVTILKIEGRARPAEYVRTVSSCYNEAIQACMDGSFGPEKIRDWDRRLARVFNRGFWDGYYLGQRLGEWSGEHGSVSSVRKVYVGKGTNYYDRIGVAEIAIENDSLKPGDEVLITGPTTGVIETFVSELRVDESPVKEAVKGQKCSFPVGQVVRRSDKVYKLVPRE